MTRVIWCRIEPGRVQFFKYIPKESSLPPREGTETIAYSGSEGCASHYSVSFKVRADIETDGVVNDTSFNVITVVPSENEQASYREIEIEGSRQIAVRLRALADAVEKDVEDFESRRTPSA